MASQLCSPPPLSFFIVSGLSVPFISVQTTTQSTGADCIVCVLMLQTSRAFLFQITDLVFRSRWIRSDACLCNHVPSARISVLDPLFLFLSQRAALTRFYCCPLQVCANNGPIATRKQSVPKSRVFSLTPVYPG